MKFVIDSQLPRRMVAWLANAGCDAIQTLDLPNGNQTTDAQLIACADTEQRVAVTKDADFVNSHLLHGRKPAKLLLVSTGNISNRELDQFVVPLIAHVVQEFRTNSFVELGRSGIVVRG